MYYISNISYLYIYCEARFFTYCMLPILLLYISSVPVISYAQQISDINESMNADTNTDKADQVVQAGWVGRMLHRVGLT